MDFKQLIDDLIFNFKKGWTNTLVAAIAGTALILHNYGFMIDDDLVQKITTFAIVWLGFNTSPAPAPSQSE